MTLCNTAISTCQIQRMFYQQNEPHSVTGHMCHSQKYLQRRVPLPESPTLLHTHFEQQLKVIVELAPTKDKLTSCKRLAIEIAFRERFLSRIN
jgi:hypothetical protein